MADTTHEHHQHGPSLRLYMTIAFILAVCTAMSFLFNTMMQQQAITALTSFLLILLVAIIKATLVGTYFMHLKWDWNFLYFLIIPAFILGAMMMIVLMPDILLGQSHEAAVEIRIANEYR